MHFLSIAAQAMRRLLVDHARRRSREKRGGGAALVTLDSAVEAPSGGACSALDLVALDQALEKLTASEPEKARLVELRFFGGLTAEEAAEAMGVSLRTVERYWLYARAWLHRELAAAPVPRASA